MDFEALKLEHQLCFPLYASARQIVKQYTPLLDAIGLTYTQYIVMLVLWETPSTTSKELGERLHLDSGTLTPLLKRLEAAGLIARARAAHDERNLTVTLTEQGAALKAKAADVPRQMRRCLPLTDAESLTLYQLLYKILRAE